MIRGNFSIKDASIRLRIKPWTIKRLESLGRIPAPRRDPFSGDRIYSEEELVALEALIAELGQSNTATRVDRLRTAR